MYAEYFGLKELPFRITPDTRFFFVSGTHSKALAYATYGLDKAEGFIVITGEIGAGKTTLVDYLISKIRSDNQQIAKIVSTQVQADNLLRMVAVALDLPQEGSNKASVLQRIQEHLVERSRRGLRTLLIVDEAQGLVRDCLEELRMLSNFQNNGQPVMQIFLTGQPEFRSFLAQKGLEQLRQRIIAYHHLGKLCEEETRQYIEHRLRRAGWRDDPTFAEAAFEEVHHMTRGVPRSINLLCDRLLLASFLDDRHEIRLADVRSVAEMMRAEQHLGVDDMPCAERERGDAGAPSTANSELKELMTSAKRIRELELELKGEKSRLKRMVAKASSLFDGR